jgi:hypothetical protein
MSDFYIAQEWLEVSRDTAFFYPAAGSDYTEPLTIFQNYVSEFWFSDIYPTGLQLPPVCAFHTDLHPLEQNTSGEPFAIMETRRAENGRRYRFVQPSKLTEVYETTDGRHITVVRRRGFGQIGLTKEFGERSLGVFMHRGDSPGEGGSNVYFLANKKTYYEPCGSLFNKLARRLKDRALVISDGSNTNIRQLRRFHSSSTEGRQAFAYHQGRDFDFGGFRWSCVGWLSMKNGPTLVWGLTRQP